MGPLYFMQETTIAAIQATERHFAYIISGKSTKNGPAAGRCEGNGPVPEARFERPSADSRRKADFEPYS
jgi:hypothetical protein